jgi:hypothetical protein
MARWTAFVSGRLIRSTGDFVRTDYAPTFPAGQGVGAYSRTLATDRQGPVVEDAYEIALLARQRMFLRDLARRAFPRRPVLHDVSGGGRTLRMPPGAVRAAYTYDASNASAAPVTVEGPALVTVLGPLPGGHDRAVAFAAQVLPDPDAGLLVLRQPRHPHQPGQSLTVIERLLTRHGFEVIERRGFALCPPGGYEHPWLRPIAQRIDDLVSRYGSAVTLATEVLYVARRLPRLRPPRRTRPPQQRWVGVP